MYVKMGYNCWYFEVFSFVMDVLIPGVLNQVIMNKFSVTSEEVSYMYYVHVLLLSLLHSI